MSSSPFWSCSLLIVVAQIRFHILVVSSSPPVSNALFALDAYDIARRVQFSSFFPRRLASNCSYPRCNRRSREQLVLFDIKDSIHTENRTHGSTTALYVKLKDRRYILRTAWNVVCATIVDVARLDVPSLRPVFWLLAAVGWQPRRIHAQPKQQRYDTTTSITRALSPSIAPLRV